jgi:hypothetical protein
VFHTVCTIMPVCLDIARLIVYAVYSLLESGSVTVAAIAHELRRSGFMLRQAQMRADSLVAHHNASHINNCHAGLFLVSCPGLGRHPNHGMCSDVYCTGWV